MGNFTLKQKFFLYIEHLKFKLEECGHQGVYWYINS